MIGVVVWTASDNSGEGKARLVFSGIQKQSEPMPSTMIKPHYQGMDVNNQPYTVLADSATQKDKDTVVMQAVRADVLRTDGKWLALNAAAGELNTQSKQLALTGGVNMFYDGGYEFRSDHAQVDIQEGSAYGDSPVEGQGPLGTLKADSFSVTDRGKVIRFNGSVKMTLYP